MPLSRRAFGCATVGAVALTAAGCAETTRASRDASNAAGTPSATGSGEAPSGAVPLDDVAMARPAALTEASLSPDILITADGRIAKALVAKVHAVKGVEAVTVLSVGQFYSEETPVHYAAVNPATFRRFTPPGSAQTQAIWNRVAGGEMAIRTKLGKRLQDERGYVQMGNDKGSPLAHVGAYTPLISRFGGESVIDAVVNERWVRRLPSIKRGNALLVSTGDVAPRQVKKAIRAVLGKEASIQILAVDLDPGTQTAVLTGGAVSASLGTVRYTANADGSVNLDPRWVSSYIRTEKMPIIGNVTGNRLMLPELRAALSEVVARGLADKIHPAEYGGCFVPRFIAGTHTLSFHTFGTAIDLNVPGNQRGTVGEMDRGVVAIFKKWGFGWGGDWRYTDPMHFELHRLVRAG